MLGLAVLYLRLVSRDTEVKTGFLYGDNSISYISYLRYSDRVVQAIKQIFSLSTRLITWYFYKILFCIFRPFIWSSSRHTNIQLKATRVLALINNSHNKTKKNALMLKLYCLPTVFHILLTPRCRVLLEKLTGLQLVKKFPAFHRTRRFITALTSVRHLSLSWASPIQSIYPHPTSWRSILILSNHLRLGLPSGSFPPVTLALNRDKCLASRRKSPVQRWIG